MIEVPSHGISYGFGTGDPLFGGRPSESADPRQSRRRSPKGGFLFAEAVGTTLPGPPLARGLGHREGHRRGSDSVGTSGEEQRDTRHLDGALSERGAITVGTGRDQARREPVPLSRE